MQALQAELADKTADRELELLKIKVKADTELAVAKIREAGRTDQEEIKAFSSTLETILARTATITEAMYAMQAAPQEWTETEYDNYGLTDVLPQEMQQGEPQDMPQDMPQEMPQDMPQDMPFEEGLNEGGEAYANAPQEAPNPDDMQILPTDENNPAEGF